MSARVIVIAEAGVNHNGDPELALRLIDAAAEAGADAVKFQTFRAESLVSMLAPKAAYQKTATGAEEGQFGMLRRLELSQESHRRLLHQCRECGIRFISTPFDVDSLRFLAAELKVEVIKIGSGNLTDAPLLLAAGRAGLPVILSTGMGTLAEIEDALGVLAFGYVAEPDARPSRRAFAKAFMSDAGRAAVGASVTLLHCTTEYPAPASEANLRAMESMRCAFGLPVGLSDHTSGIAVAVAAIALGAVMIEKHLTLDRTMVGPDHAASLEPEQFAALVAAVHEVDSALGDGNKMPQPSEIKNMEIARKSLVTLRAVAAGEAFSVENLGTLRPGTGASAMDYFDWLGRTADRDYGAGEVVAS